MTQVVNITDTDVMLLGTNISAGTKSNVFRAQASSPVTIQTITGDGSGIQGCTLNIYAGNTEDTLKLVATVVNVGTELFTSNVAFKFWQVEFVSGYADVQHVVIIAQ